MHGPICVSECDIANILKCYKCINRYTIDVTYFEVFVTVYINESLFVMDLLEGIDVREVLETLKYRVPVSIKLTTNINFE